MSTAVNHVSFSLNAETSGHRVIVDQPLTMSGLEYTRVYDNYEPSKALSLSNDLMQWASGEKTKGMQTIEEGLLEGTLLTAVGKVTLRSGILKIKPPDDHEYILSQLTLDGIIRDKTKIVRGWGYVTVGFAIAGTVLLLIWFYRKWWRRSGRVARDRFTLPPDDSFDEDVAEQAEGQTCVICLTQRRNVVILDCGHICACRACAMQVNICPICRAHIVRLVPTYQS